MDRAHCALVFLDESPECGRESARHRQDLKSWAPASRETERFGRRTGRLRDAKKRSWIRVVASSSGDTRLHMARILRYRILIVDNQPIFRHGLRKVISSESDLCVVGEANGGSEVPRMAAALKPDVIILENQLPESATAGILGELNKLRLSAFPIVMVDEIRRTDVLENLRLGARGVLGKDSSPELLVRCIRNVAAGQYWIGPESVVHLVEILRNPSSATPKTFGLTERELQVVQAITDGCTNREIAEQFFISQQTVKHHLNKIFDKVGVSNRLELAMFVIHHGIVKNSQSQKVAEMSPMPQTRPHSA